ncbi:uncharacterized protein [Venturia canescens]|uniref:uncharacterized protein n=1 Tax=Venturia canescens TaxID=32260 RepID=UPI001C9CAA96|nr:uncharacterized protein LOC122407789 [Venturia canescens]
MNRGNIVKFVLIYGLLQTGQTLIHDGFAKVFGSVGSITNVKTTQLLNQLCNDSQDDNTMQRDACYGCFFRSSQLPSGYPMLLSMASCADAYLNNTNYGHCRAYLRNATNAIDARTSPTIIYCTFLECIRQVNKNNLDARSGLYREGNRSSNKFKFITRKTKPIVFLRRYVSVIRGICIVRSRADEEANTVRPGAEPISPRSNFNVDRINIIIARTENA